MSLLPVCELVKSFYRLPKKFQVFFKAKHERTDRHCVSVFTV